jgi:hypothetical protein
MPKKTYTQINSITLAAASSSVTFGSIPQNFRDLVLVASVRHSTSNGGYIGYRLNGNSGTNYSSVYMLGNGSTAFSSSTSAESFGRFGNGGTGNFESTIFNIFDYPATNKHKTALTRTDIASIYTVAYATRWASTDAVTSILLFPDSGDFTAGSTFTLYGIEA